MAVIARGFSQAIGTIYPAKARCCCVPSSGGRANEKTAVPVYLLASERHADRINLDIAGVDLAGGRPILEPMAQYGLCRLLATEITLREQGDELVLVVPSDHEITTDRDFWDTVKTGIGAANAGRIVVFGIQPERPETGYGYIEVALEVSATRDVLRFVESRTKRRPRNIWNRGIFSEMPGFSSSVPATSPSFKAHAAEIWDKAIIALDQADTNISGTYLPHDLYAAVPSISVDYAIMEHASDIALVPATFRWNDLGSGNPCSRWVGRWQWRCDRRPCCRHRLRAQLSAQ